MDLELNQVILVMIAIVCGVPYSYIITRSVAAAWYRTKYEYLSRFTKGDMRGRQQAR